MSRVLSRVRVIVTELVREARVQETERAVLSQTFVDQVVDELRWNVQTIVEREVTAGGSDDAIARRVLDALRLEVRTAVRTVLEKNQHIQVGASFYDSSVFDTLVERVLDDLRIIVLQEINVVRSRLLVDQENSKAALVQTIATRVSPTIRAFARTVVSQSYPAGATEDEMVQELIVLLQPAIYKYA